MTTLEPAKVAKSTATGPEPSEVAPLPGVAVPAQQSAIIDIVAPLDIDKLAQAFKKFEAFKTRLLSGDDWVSIQNKKFLKKSAWRKWALACGVSDELLSQERVPAIGKDVDGNFYYRIVVRAYHVPTGRSSVGTAIASKSEKRNWSHEEHDIFALACTRAKNRAIADLVGGGEVSAEEVDTGPTNDVHTQANNSSKPLQQTQPVKVPAKPTAQPTQAEVQSTWRDTTGEG